LRREPLEVRKATLASVLAKAAPGLRLNEHIEADRSWTQMRDVADEEYPGGQPHSPLRDGQWLANELREVSCRKTRK
jgi:hypothetical protein